MPGVKQGDTIKVHYTGRLDDGEVFDSSDQKEPFQFTVGKREVIPGFEQAVLGMSPGDNKTTTISAHRAYGPRQQDLVVEVDRKNINDDVDLEIGQRLKIKQPDGQEFVVRITEVSDSTVKLDANHPLAGKNLTFDINLVDIVGG
jgi:FKBP-type peptidyl-prolyl cis-trans isomerase 2